MNVTMIGLGKLGLPVAEVMAEKHFVKGYDIDTNIKNDKIKITKLAQGIPIGGELDLLDYNTMSTAFSSRLEILNCLTQIRLEIVEVFLKTLSFHLINLKNSKQSTHQFHSIKKTLMHQIKKMFFTKFLQVG